ncbi:PIG-L family deacetylase [Patescibacteria group bacterium]|nr:PIG-L family deacetylase [Patescibacteria group bacterium]
MARFPKPKPLIVAGACLLIGLLAYFFWALPDSAAETASQLSQYSQFPPLKPTDRLTIISPHLDDETIGLGGFIARARREQVPVSVIFMTNGDDNPIGADFEFRTGYPGPNQLIQSGMVRQHEAINALAQLGVSSNEIYFLGLPDRGLKSLLQPQYASQPYRAPGTLASDSPYPNSYQPNIPYTGDAIRQALTQAINQTQPTLIFTTLPQDHHADHAATAVFVQQIEPQLTTHPTLYYFLIHYSRYPRPAGVNHTLPLLPPKPFDQEKWQIIPLDAADINRQQAATNQYKTQLRIPLLGRLMQSFVRSNELALPAS